MDIMKTLLQLYRDNASRVKPANLLVNAAEASIYIYDIISPEWGYSALNAISDISSIGDAPVLNVRISSPGGDVFESRAIMNAIKRFPGKTVAHIDGLCASAATSIALACDEVEISADSMFMIHNAQCMAFGDKSDLRATADLMETIELAIVNDYTVKTGKSDDEVKALMQAETWMTATQAVENKFVDRIAAAPAKVSNTWNLAAYAKAPAALTAQAPSPEPEQAPQLDPVIEPAPCMTQTNKNRLALNLAI